MDAVLVTPARVVMQNATSNGFSLLDWIKSISLHLPNIVDIGLGLGTTVWLYYLIKVPWNLYLSTRRIRIEGEESVEQGIKPDEINLEKIRKLEKALFLGVCAAHALSAIGIYGIAWLTEERFIKKNTSFLFVGAAFVRPALEYKRYIVARIETLRARIQYPTNHVQIMLTKIDDITKRISVLEKDNEKNKEKLAELQSTTVPDIRSNLASLAKTQDNLAKTQDTQHKALTARISSEVEAIKNQAISDRNNVNAKFTEVSKKFESTIIDLSNDKKILEGVRGFLAIVQESLWQPNRSDSSST